MGLSDSDYMSKADRDRPDSHDPREVYYNPKEFRVQRAHEEHLSAWREPEIVLTDRNTGKAGIGGWLFPAAAGFLFSCLAGLLGWRVFDWGVQIMRPVAQLVLDVTR